MSAAAAITLRRSAAWAFSGQGFYLGCQWILMAILTRFGGADAAGLYALGLAVCAPVMVLANLHLRELQASDARDEFRLAERLAVRLGALSAAMIIIVVIAYWSPWAGLTSAVILAVGCAKSIEAMADLGYGALQAHGRFRTVAVAQGIRAISGLAVAVTVFLFTNQVAVAVGSLALCWLVAVLFIDRPLVARVIAPSSIVPAISPTRLASLLRQALPMGAVGGIGTITLMFPSYAIQHYLGTDELGHFTAVQYLILIGNVAALSLGQAASPAFGRTFAQGDHRGFLRLLVRVWLAVVGLGLLTVLVCWLVGDILLALVYGDSWAVHAPLLVWVAIAASVQWFASVLGFASTAARRLTLQVPIALLACGVSGLTSWWLIPTSGLVGAALSGIITCGFLVVCYLGIVLAPFPPAGSSRP